MRRVRHRSASLQRADGSTTGNRLDTGLWREHRREPDGNWHLCWSCVKACWRASTRQARWPEGPADYAVAHISRHRWPLIREDTAAAVCGLQFLPVCSCTNVASTLPRDHRQWTARGLRAHNPAVISRRESTALCPAPHPANSSFPSPLPTPLGPNHPSRPPPPLPTQPTRSHPIPPNHRAALQTSVAALSLAPRS